MHSLIVGQTGTGKTTLACRLVAEYARRGIHSVVLDPILDGRWPTRWLTADPEEFTSWAATSRSCALWIDESGETIGQYHRELFWAATRARHLGHLSHFLTQRPAQLSPTVRNQCSRLYCFGLQSLNDCKSVAQDWGRTPESQAAIFQLAAYPAGRFLYITRFSDPITLQIGLDKIP